MTRDACIHMRVGNIVMQEAGVFRQQCTSTPDDQRSCAHKPHLHSRILIEHTRPRTKPVSVRPHGQDLHRHAYRVLRRAVIRQPGCIFGPFLPAIRAWAARRAQSVHLPVSEVLLAAAVRGRPRAHVAGGSRNGGRRFVCVVFFGSELCVCMYVCMYIYIYIYVVCICT
jgi:hypothetical protein